jgi:hypothetical protein
MAKTIGQLTQATTLASGDEFVIEQTGLTKRVAASVVRGGLIDANIDAAAAIAFSKLASLDSANILVGNGSNVATKVAVTGDVTISNAGVTAIGSAKVTPTMLSQPLTLATAKTHLDATLGGTVIDFTGIPSWVRRITVMLDGVSTNGASNPLIQIGTSGGIQATGYVASGAQLSSGNSYTTGFGFPSGLSANVLSGAATLYNVTGNVWTISGLIGQATNMFMVAGTKSLSGTLDRIRLTTVDGTDTFDAGSVNIMYEG